MTVQTTDQDNRESGDPFKRSRITLSALYKMSSSSTHGEAPMSGESRLLMQSLLQQARLFLAQGQPSKALNCVLAAVRHQRGEAGVFAVLNETRVAHGLHALAVPEQANQLPAGAPAAPQLMPSIDEGNMMEDDDDEGEETKMSDQQHHQHHASSNSSSSRSSSASNEATEIVERLFRQLGVSSPPSSSSSASVAASSSVPFSASAMPHGITYPSPAATSSSSYYPAAASSSSSSSSSFNPPSNFHPDDYIRDSEFESMNVPEAIPNSHHTIRYPSMRTVLPSLSGSMNSGTTLEEMHDHPQSSSASSAAAASASAMDNMSMSLDAPSAASSSSSSIANTTPLLQLAGRHDVLDAAYDSQSSVICPQCQALIPQARFAAHIQWWCQAEED